MMNQSFVFRDSFFFFAQASLSFLLQDTLDYLSKFFFIIIGIKMQLKINQLGGETKGSILKLQYFVFGSLACDACSQFSFLLCQANSYVCVWLLQKV